MQITVTINGQVVTAEQSVILALLGAPSAPAKAPRKAPAKAPAAKKECPAWITEAAKNRDARQALAKAMRANGEDPHGDLWATRKAEAGIK